MKNKKKYLGIMLIAFAIVTIFFTTKAFAAPNTVDIPDVNISLGGEGTPKDYVDNIKLLIFLTILTLLPSVIMMATCFTRIVVVFSFLKGALGAQQSIPNQVLIGISLFLTIFIMQPVYTTINDNAFKPFMENTINQDQAFEAGAKPLREFMLAETRQKDLELFIETSKINKEEVTRENVPLYVVVPAFAISELKTAFEIGFLLFLPFLIIDMVVASVLMSMGMFMLPPVMIALPFKLLLFVMVDGWYLITRALVLSFG
ncbi:flagellar type III secretion system pore protein FliP [Clostridium gasigenes]|uniref:flagellar type III secretion system pore protein FliP n=1 Tax=Clostridium gasigenes TaxID=94869 RepID=UPI001C0AC240|nr:flagellar type III secretion system pore protein FliP [Clostridium gasigenes]MBU3132129.1 flagellar type III secretion system pore protein FliP [Clostridium gasigenes]